MNVNIEKDQSSNKLFLLLKVDDQTVHVPISPYSTIQLSVVENARLKKRNACPPQRDLKTLQETYSKEMQLLADRGFSDKPRLGLRLLSRFDGDVEKVCSLFEQRRKRCEKHNKQEIPSTPKTPNPGEISCRKSAWAEKIAKLEETYATQLEELSQLGFDNTLLNIRLLVRFDGNLNRVLDVLLRRFQEGRDDDVRGRCGFEERCQTLRSYASQLAFLEKHGFDKPRRNLIALKKNNGDQEAALSWLQQRGRNHHAGPKGKCASHHQRELSHQNESRNPRMMRLKRFKKSVEVIPQCQ